MKRLLLVSLAGFSGLIAQASSIPAYARLDSLGVERKDGKLYVLHRIEQGQTLFSLVRKYKTTVQDIKGANPGMADNVRYDQVVRVPVTTLSRKEERALTKAIKKEEKKQEKEEAETKNEDANSGIHQVELGQTLYSLATRYGVSMDELRKWNNLSNDHIISGQALIVSARAWRIREPTVTVPVMKVPSRSETTPVVPAKTVARSDSPKIERPSSPRTITNHQEPLRTASPREESTSRPAESDPLVSAPSETRIIRPGDSGPLPNPSAQANKIAEIGIAEVIDPTDNSNKYLALHRAAPIGTLVLVKNDMNQQGIWVKVIGRLPDTSINDKVIVKISARAFEKLSPADRRFRAEVSYLQP